MIGWQLGLLILLRLVDKPASKNAVLELSKDRVRYKTHYANALKGWGFFSLSLVALILGFGWVAVSLYLDIQQRLIESMNWFGRSGAVLVLLSAWVEWEAMRLNWQPEGRFGIWTFDNPRLRYFVRKTRLFVLLVLVCGTLIWAYGDLWITYR